MSNDHLTRERSSPGQHVFTQNNNINKSIHEHCSTSYLFKPCGQQLLQHLKVDLGGLPGRTGFVGEGQKRLAYLLQGFVMGVLVVGAATLLPLGLQLVNGVRGPGQRDVPQALPDLVQHHLLTVAAVVARRERLGPHLPVSFGSLASLHEKHMYYASQGGEQRERRASRCAARVLVNNLIHLRKKVKKTTSDQIKVYSLKQPGDRKPSLQHVHYLISVMTGKEPGERFPPHS